MKSVTREQYTGDVWNLTVAGSHTFHTHVGMSHNTVKPLALMRHLVRLVTPPRGLVLDPFCGSGTTGMACAFEQLDFIGVEGEAAYADIAKARIANAEVAARKGYAALPVPAPAQEDQRSSEQLDLFDVARSDVQAAAPYKAGTAKGSAPSSPVPTTASHAT